LRRARQSFHYSVDTVSIKAGKGRLSCGTDAERAGPGEKKRDEKKERFNNPLQEGWSVQKGGKRISSRGGESSGKMSRLLDAKFKGEDVRGPAPARRRTH